MFRKCLKSTMFAILIIQKKGTMKKVILKAIKAAPMFIIPLSYYQHGGGSIWQWFVGLF